MRIEKGSLNDINELENLYDDLNDYLEIHVNFPGWRKGIYPVKETALKGIEEGNLFVIKNDEHIMGSVILRHKPELAYSKADWKIDLEDKDIYVVYTFAIHPLYLKRGVGKALMDFIIQYSKDTKIKAIRLDVYEKNIPAIHLYKKCGFQYIDTVDLGYSAYGLDKFELYQKIL
ncbi:GNAT family N-acetyltransferase [Kineothrix sp. MB12-C1]|uniref:GNAT family N-acetyltransferase n=1 Tax=Kineothrix sp. MB12-C1 TaxID=3070215 RepID=UPI0027D236CF|nr:GNAT family N-acetyltransferase [Kineothrix sp. MB12-C1]WMC92588.1 GNAT family N-acetyltransferase [Kineothrix sp. MB12-C1]